MMNFRTKRFLPLTMVAALAVAGCTSSTPTATNATVSPTTASETTTSAPETTSAPSTTTGGAGGETKDSQAETEAEVQVEGPTLEVLDWQIDWDGVGPVKVGVTLEETSAALPPGLDIGEEVVLGEGISGHAVSLDGEVLLYVASYDFEDPRFEVLLIESPRLMLASGLHVGMTLADAVWLHGEPEFWFHTASHGRESVSFADGTGDSGETIHIESSGVDALQAGIYGDADPSDPDLFRTTEYDPAGTISAIRVSCFGAGRQSCPPQG